MSRRSYSMFTDSGVECMRILKIPRVMENVVKRVTIPKRRDAAGSAML